jgi:hypothetical protein
MLYKICYGDKRVQFENEKSACQTYI